MTYVDERIVELRFDNKQFEQETAKTMSTLDKLKEKLQFKNASSGAEQLQKAVANINVNPIIQGIGTIETKMSAMAIAGKRVIENIVDWAMSGLGKIESKLAGVVNQVVTGGKNRALNIEQAKFQLKGLGVAWESIQEDINYGVQDTAYGLDAAAKVASQLVASNVQLGDDMKHALLGISGVAAMTNSTYEDIGHIYTTVAGNGRLMGEQLLQLSGRGINAAATLAKALNVTEAEVREMVGKSEISFQMFSDAMFEAFGEHAKSANETFTGALSNTKAALSRLGADVAAQGFNSIRDILNDLIPKLKEFKKKMKPVEDAIISMIDAIGKLVQTLVNSLDIEKIVNRLTPILKGAADAITDFALAYEHVFTFRNTKHNDAAFFAEQRGLARLKETTVDVTSAMEDLYNISDEQKTLADEIWKEGKHGNGAERVKNLGKDYNMVQAYIEKMIEFGWDEAKMNSYLAEQQKAHEKAVEDTARAYKKKALVENLFDIFGNLKHVVKNIADSIKNVLTVAFSSLSDAFKDKSLMEMLVIFTKKLADLSDKFKITEERAEKLRPVFDGIFTIIKKLAKAVKFLITQVINLLKKINFQKIFKTIKKAVTAISDAVVKLYKTLKDLGIFEAVYTVLKKIGEAMKFVVTQAIEFLKAINFKKILEGLKRAFLAVRDAIVKVYEKLKELGIWEKFVSVLKTIWNFLSDFIVENLDKIVDALTMVIDKLVSGFKWVVNKLKNFDAIIEFFKRIIESIKSLTLSDALHAGFVVGLIMTVLKIMELIWRIAVIGKKAGKLVVGVTKFVGSLRKLANIYGKKAQAEIFDMFASAVVKMVGSIIAIMVALAVLEGLGFDSMKLLGIATAVVVGLLVLYGVIQILVAKFSKTNITDHAITFAALKLPLMIIGISVLLKALISAAKFFYGVLSDKELNVQAFVITMGVIVGFVAVMFLLIQSLAKSADNSVSMTGIMGVVFAISLMMYVLMKALERISKLVTKNSKATEKAFGYLAVLVLEVFGFLIAMRALAGHYGENGNSSIKGIFATLLGVTALLRFGILPLMEAVIDVYDSGDKSSNRRKGLRKFEDMAQALLLFVAVVAGVTLALSKEAKGTPIFAMAAVIGAMALLFGALALAIHALKGVDSDNLQALTVLIDSLVVIIGVLSIALALLSSMLGPSVTGAMLGLAAAIAAIGIAMLAGGAGFYIFQKGLNELIKSLPGMVDNLLLFFKKVDDNYDELVDGISTTISLMGDGFLAALGAFFENAAKFIPAFISSLMEMLVIIIDGVAIALDKYGGPLAEAAYNLAIALVKFLGTVFDLWKEMAVPLCETVGLWLAHNIKIAIIHGLRKVLEGLDDWLVGLSGLNRNIPYFSTAVNQIRSGISDLEDELDNYENVVDKAYDAAQDQIQFAWDKPKGDHYKEAEKYAAESSAWMNEALENGTKVESWSDYVMNKITSGKDEDWVGGISSWVKERMGGLKDELAKQLKGEFSNVDLTKMISFDQLKNFSAQDFMNEFGINMSQDSWNSFLGGIDENWSADSPEFENYMNDFFGQMNLYDGDWQSTGITWGTNLGTGYESTEEKNIQIAKDMQDKIVDKLYEYEPKFYVAGKYCAAGFGEGFGDKDQEEKNFRHVNELVLDMRNKLAETAEIGSPSKLFERLGAFCTMGFGNGIANLGYYAEDATEDVGENAIDTMKAVIKRLYDRAIEGLDLSPRITPVLDLSELEAGMQQANSMFNGSYAMAATAGGGFNRGLANRFSTTDQSTYDDTNVVEAINGLRAEMTTMEQALNGLGFYVDGREMAKALAKPMNNELNDISLRAGRGVR